MGKKPVVRAAVRRRRLAGDGLAEAERILGEILPGTRVAGVDEAGRGCLAGPVVAAAVVLPVGAPIPGLTDSKLIRPELREQLAAAIQAAALTWAVAAVEAAEIDATNILQATLAAMRAAVCQLTPPPDLVLVDGNVAPRLPMATRAVVKGDLLVPVISAASILAKVSRDRIMQGWALEFPAYGFAEHKGYGTAFHLAAIAREGPSPIHRRSFAGVREYFEESAQQGELW